MDIIAIESKTFEQMKERFKGFSNQVKDLCGDNQDKEQWLGNEDVCALLQISLRTLLFGRRQSDTTDGKGKRA